MVRRFPAIGLDKRAENFVSIFETYLPKQSRILDVGGRWGFYGAPLRTRGHHMTVLDVVRPDFHKEPVVVYEGGRFPFADRSFEVSLVATMLHHVENPAALLREIRRVTARCVILIEDLYHHRLGRWWTITRDRLYNFEWFGHPCQFRKAGEWIRLFQKEGFSLAGQKQIYTWLTGLRILNGVFIFEVTP